MKVSPYENPYVLATQLGSWLHNWKMAPEHKRDYADAPQIRNISKGENLFRTRFPKARLHEAVSDSAEDRKGASE